MTWAKFARGTIGWAVVTVLVGLGLKAIKMDTFTTDVLGVLAIFIGSLIAWHIV